MAETNSQDDDIAQCPNLGCRRTRHRHKLNDPALDLLGPWVPDVCGAVKLARMRALIKSRLAVLEAQGRQ